MERKTHHHITRQSSMTKVNNDEEVQIEQKKPLLSISNNDHLTNPTNVSTSPSSPSSPPTKDANTATTTAAATSNNENTISKAGLRVLVLLAIQNCSKNILMRFVMKEKPQFLHSTAVIVVELLKLIISASYIQYILHKTDKKNSSSVASSNANAFSEIYSYLQHDKKHTLLLVVPATSYSVQMSLEYVAFAHMDASTFSVLVQTKMLATAVFFWVILGRKLVRRQVMSLVLLTSGVMLCNMKSGVESEGNQGDLTGIMATAGIALSSAFASVYTEKVIKAARNNTNDKDKKALLPNTCNPPVAAPTQPPPKSLALPLMQCQLAIVSLVILGCYVLIKDINIILEKGFFYKFNFPALLSCFNSAIGGLIVAAVLKYADSVLKGYATAISVVLTGILSSLIFDTSLTLFYWMGVLNVVMAVLMYNGAGLDKYVC